MTDITNDVRDTQRQQAEMKQLSNMLLQSSSTIPHRNSITMPRSSDMTHETRTTNYVQISTPPHEQQRSPNTQSTPYITPMTTYTIPLERISLQQDKPVNIRTMHTRASLRYLRIVNLKHLPCYHLKQPLNERHLLS